MGITDDIGDKAFTDGQLSDAENLGDKGSTDASGNFVPSDWLNAFRHPVHGAILLSGPSHPSVKAMLRDVEQIFRVDLFLLPLPPPSRRFSLPQRNSNILSIHLPRPRRPPRPPRRTRARVSDG